MAKAADKRHSEGHKEGEVPFSHLDSAGKARMVDVTEKPITAREAVARGVVKMQASTLELLQQDKVAKGDVFAVARLAGIMAAKQTAHLIPLCHPLILDDINVEFRPDEDSAAVEITATVRSTGKTGVEMEALTAVTVSALTIYDMCKTVDRTMRLHDIRLVRKSGGKSGMVNLNQE